MSVLNKLTMEGQRFFFVFFKSLQEDTDATHQFRVQDV